MRILKAHNRYVGRGGEDESFESECAVLSARGHEVETYFQDNRRVAELPAWRLGPRTVWSAEDYGRLRRLMRAWRPDVVHFHNTFPLMSPAAYYAARAEGVPVVQTLPNYRLLCPSATFYRDGRPCEDCLGRALPWPAVRHACYRGSRAASASTVAMLAGHRAAGTWARLVDVYVALAEFGRRKFVEGGLPADKLVVKPNFVYPDPGPRRGSGGYALYVGRLAPEKGIGTLLAAWETLGGRVPLKVVGDGPLAPTMAEAAGRVPGVEWLGRRPASEAYALMGEAAFLVFPSEWYEGLGRTIIESFAVGTPVVSADIGAPAELVDHGRTGLLYAPGDAAGLAGCVARLLDRPEELAGMRRAARAEFEARYTAEENHRQLVAIYERAIGAGGKGRPHPRR